MTLAGVDISSYQPAGKWDKLTGVSFMTARATLGTTFADPMYRNQITGAKSIGIIPGAYHYLTPESGVLQAERFASVVGDPTGLLIQLDCERAGDVYSVIDAWVTRWNTLSGNHPVFIYGGKPFLASASGGRDLSHLGPWWLAAYPGGGYPGDSAPQWRESLAGWSQPTIWQYGPFVTPAFPHSVDGDAFRGTRDQLLAYTGAAPLQSFTWLPGPSGTITVKTDRPHAYLRLADNTTHIIPDPVAFGSRAAIPVKLLSPLPGGLPGADRVTGYLVGAEAAFLLATDVTFTAAPDTTSLKAALDAAVTSAAAAASQLSKIKEIVNA